MNFDDIKRALEAKKQFEDAGGREALEKKRLIESSGASITQIQKNASLINDVKLQAVNNRLNNESLPALLEILRRPNGFKRRGTSNSFWRFSVRK